MTVSRFAPSPNGSLHLGHAYSAIVSHDLAKARGGRFVLRIEDIDGARSLPDKPEEFRHDLAWLGLTWDEVPAQSTRLASYGAAVDSLRRDGLLYPCICTRKDIAARAMHHGPEGPIYPGICKGRPVATDRPCVLRLDTEKLATMIGTTFWHDEVHGRQTTEPQCLGDVVLMRKDAPYSYHLAATLDDAADGVTLVTRGQDLFMMTHVHRALQAVLGLPVPIWHHHALLVDEDGRKLAKRRGSPSLADRRAAGEDGLALAARLRALCLPTGIRLSSA